MNELCLGLLNGRLRVSPFAFLAPALMLYIEGTISFFVIISAAVIHELGHVFAIYALGSRVTEVFIHTVGAVIRYDSAAVSYKGDALIAFAGPFANIIFAALALPLFVVCHDVWQLLFIVACLFFATFNMLPLRGNDGSNLLYALAANRDCIDRAEKITTRVAAASCIMGTVASFTLYEATGACPAVLVMLVMTAISSVTLS